MGDPVPDEDFIPVVVIEAEKVEEIKLIILGVIEWAGESVASDQLEKALSILEGGE